MSSERESLSPLKDQSVPQSTDRNLVGQELSNCFHMMRRSSDDWVSRIGDGSPWDVLGQCLIKEIRLAGKAV